MKNRVAYFGVFTALALIFSYVETLIPFHIGIPGVKLGLANLIIVVALYKMSLKETYLLSVVRVVLSGFIFGNYFSIIYSLAGGLLSLTVMALLKKKGGFSILGISIAGCAIISDNLSSPWPWWRRSVSYTTYLYCSLPGLSPVC